MSLRRKQVLDDLNQQIRDHIERETEDNIDRGMSPDEARNAALRKFGNVTRVKEDAREVWTIVWLEHLLQDVRYAFRTMRTSLGFTTVAVLTLALSIGATTAIFSVMYALILKPLPVSQPDSLLAVLGQYHGNQHSYREWTQFRDTQDIFSDVFAYNEWDTIVPFKLTEGGDTHEVSGLYASGAYFRALGVSAIIGRTFQPSDDRSGALPVCVIGFDLWRQRYQQSQAVLGRTLVLDGHEFQVIGVAPRHFVGLEPGFKPDVFMPLENEKAFHDYPRLRNGVATTTLDDPNSSLLAFIGRLKPGVTVSQAEARLQVVGHQVYATLPPAPFTRGTYFGEPAIPSVRSTGNNDMLFLVMTMAGVALLIACANLGNLLVARAAKRQSEVATRLALGATRWRLVRQLVTENIVLALTGAAIGVLIQRWGSFALVSLISGSFAPTVLDLSWDANLVAFVLAVTLLCAILFGLAPAIGATRIPLYSAMKTMSSAGKGRHRIGNSLLIALQVALSMALLVSAGLLVRTLRSLVAKDPGYRPQGVMVAQVSSEGVDESPERGAFEGNELLNRFREMPGVMSASWTANGSRNGGLTVILHDPSGNERRPRVYAFRISSDFFKTRLTPMLAGRDFNDADTQAAVPVAIISAQAAKTFFSGRNPIGLRFSEVDGSDENQAVSVEVVGVSTDIDYQAPNYGPLSIVYRPASQCADCSAMGRYEVRVAGPIADTTKRLKDSTASLDPRLSIEFHPLSQEAEDTVERNRSMALIATLFGIFAALLAVIGVYGVTAYATAERTREIGIRMALGAQPANVIRMILNETVIVVFIGVAFGIWAGFAAAQALRGMLWQVSPSDPLTFVGAALLMLLVAAAAAFVPARRAAKADPMSALRFE